VCDYVSSGSKEKDKELLDICVGQICVYSFLVPFQEFSHIRVWNGIIFIPCFCLSPGASFRKISSSLLLGSSIEILLVGRMTSKIWYFCTYFIENNLPQFLCYVRFDCERFCPTHQHKETQSAVKHIYDNKRAVLLTYRHTDY
jgi:hypothetical protein